MTAESDKRWDKNGFKYIIYYYKRSGECLNKITGSSYTQIVVIK
jgi:hypothetical protein